jgi:hypothetical protein
MALVSLKQEGDDDIEAYRPNQFGYGTEIYLNGEQCEALGITKMMRAGQGVTIKANGVVKRSTEELEASMDSGGKDVSMCIQLTEIEVRAVGGSSAAKAAAMLYGDDE